ncbi:MAG: ABC transporter permease [Fibrobacterota bacterium]
MPRFELGSYIESAIDWLSNTFSVVFGIISTTVEALVGAFQTILIFPNQYLMAAIIVILVHLAFSGGEKKISGAAWKKSGGMVIFAVIGLLLLMSLDLWTETMQTIALVISAAFLAMVIGIPLGIYAARNDRFESIIRPILDLMQTMPPFVYLIPAILFFSVGNVPGVVATVVFAVPPAVRLTSLGIRNVSKEVVEAALSFGATNRQLLFKVQIPLAKNTILAGVNQVIMLALSMVVIASMVGASGLGQLVYKGILRADLALGFEAGLGIVIIAILLDRITQAVGNIPKKK